MKVRSTIEINYKGQQNLAEAIQRNAEVIFFHLLNARKGYAPNDTLEALEGR